MLRFVTGNRNKLEEARSVIPDLEQLDLDLPEIQEVDPQAVIEAKLQAALAQHQAGIVVEDTSLFVDSLKGLPGPLIKWFEKTVGYDGLARMAAASGDAAAEARVTLGYADESGNISYFSGSIRGTIVPSRGEGFGWDVIFQPEGETRTFAEMPIEEKNAMSMRKIAFEKLKEALGRRS